MGFATARTVALQGAVGHLIEVQADVSPGQVGTTVVGRADAALNEGRERVRMAIINSGLDWPATRRITVLLSPADLPKNGSHYDLAVAVAVLGANDVVPPGALAQTAFIGELALDGGLRAVTGVLPMVLAAKQRGLGRVVVPEPQAGEAQMVTEMEVVGLRSLAQVVATLRGELPPLAPAVPPLSGRNFLTWRGEERLDEVDMADMLGMPDTRYAVEVAAAGGHHLLLTGPKGCGKTSIAERIPGILPDLDQEAALELTAVRSLAGVLDPADGLAGRPPFSAPHHDASKASIVGGGHGRVRPGAISLAHGGVLFLDEFPLFRTDVIDALRQPLESGEITVARGDEVVTLPARCLFVLASNPCPCGNYHPSPGESRCECRKADLMEYDRRIKGPVSDRVDILRRLRPMRPHEVDRFTATETSAQIRERVVRARAVQAERFAGMSWRLNGQAPGPALLERWPLPVEQHKQITDQVYDGKLSRRGAVRVHRLAWTVADLAGVSRPGEHEVDTAIRLRTGEPLTVASVQRRAAG